MDDRQGTRPAHRRGAKDPPPAPWGSFPLSEVVVFIAILLLIGGFFVPPPRGAVMLGAGLALGSLAGLELAGREHFAGYRSHTMVLAGAVGILVMGGVYTLDVAPLGVSVAGGVLGFGLAAWRLATAFRRRSGGALYKFKP